MLGYGELVISEGGGQEQSGERFMKEEQARVEVSWRAQHAVVLDNGTMFCEQEQREEATKAGKAMVWWTLWASVSIARMLRAAEAWMKMSKREHVGSWPWVSLPGFFVPGSTEELSQGSQPNNPIKASKRCPVSSTRCMNGGRCYGRPLQVVVLGGRPRVLLNICCVPISQALMFSGEKNPVLMHLGT